MNQINYEIKEFTIKEIFEDKLFKIPKFQRGISWDIKKRQKFIKTFREGKPFGIILVYLNDRNYTLVDGLQRISTLLDYKENFEKYIEDILDLQIIEKIYINFFKLKNESKQVLDKRIKDLKKVIINFYKEKENSFSEIETFDLVKELKNKFSLEDNNELLWSLLEKLNKDFYKKKDIFSFKVPAIVYKGKIEDLPDIFEKINSGSVILSKYEILASTWSNDIFKINDNQIKNAIKEKYEILQDESELELEFNIDDINDEINFFEYCYALGNLLYKNSNILFGENNNLGKVDSLGFDILCLICDLPINEAKNLRQKFNDLSQENFLIKIKEIILEATNEISCCLHNWLIKPNGKFFNYPSHYMYYHMIISYIKNNYEINFSEYKIIEKRNKNWNRKFKKNLPHWLLQNIVSHFWENHRQVSDLLKLSQDEKELNKYTTVLSIKEWEDEIYNWIKEQNEINKMNQISLENKIFLNFIHILNLSEKEYFNKFNNQKTNIEHIVSKYYLTSIKDFVPVSSIANLCYLSEILNKSKKEKNVHEYKNNIPEYNDFDISNNEIFSIINYPLRKELSFLQLSSDNLKEGYKNFIKDRAVLLSKSYSEKICNYFLNN